MGQELFRMEGISKSFPGVKALDHVSLSVNKGEVLGLVGENGAGKSTLMKILSGVYRADEGEIFIEGEKVIIDSVAKAHELGVSIIMQELNMCGHLSVADNIFIGRAPKKGMFIDDKRMHREAKAILDDLGIDLDTYAMVGSLSIAKQQMVEIAKAVSYHSDVIVFDEPTSSLTEEEVEHLFRIINMLRDRGCGIIYISHKMEEILRISDEVTVMRDGAWVATEPAAEMTMERIIKLMVGRELTNRFPPKDNEIGGVLLEVEGLTAMHSKLRDVSFNVHKGEIVGLAGLDGSGRTEVLENIFGVATRKSGVIRLHGKEVKNRRARDAIKNKFALLTEERRATGIFGILDIQENTTISSLKKYKVKGLYLSRKKMEESTEWSIRAMRIKTPSQDTKIRSLSGGNQQKVILGRWLLTDPEVLLLDEPTRGIDVGAKYEIYQLIINLAKEGKAVIMVSSEMPELLGVCDRILVMSGGRLAGEVDAKATTQEEIMTLAAKYA